MDNKRPLQNRGQRSFDYKKTTKGRTSGKGKGKLLDPKLFVKKGIAQEETKHEPTRLIDELQIHPSIIQNLIKKGKRYLTVETF